MSKQKIKVLVVPSDRTGVGYFRSTKPHIALQNQFPEEFHIDIDYEPKLNSDSFLKQYDLIHFHRTLGSYENMEQLMNKCRDLGVKTIMDLDDYWAPGTHHPAYLLIKQSGLDSKIKNNLKLPDYVTTTTDIFAKEISKLNKNVKILPNAIDPNERQFISKPTKSDRLRIGWLGGSSHLKDLELLKGMVAAIKNAGLIDKVQFVLCGYDLRGQVTMIDEKTGKQSKRPIKPHESVWYKYEKIFTDDYKIVSPEYKNYLMKFKKDEYSDIENEPYRRVWTKPISTYASNYNLFDVSLAPLEENIFNEMKSQLKVIEAAFHKKALIAQDFGPYKIDCENIYERGGEINKNGNAFLIPSIKNNKFWTNHIKKLINNPELVTMLQNNLHDSITKKYNIEKVTQDRANFYKQIIN